MQGYSTGLLIHRDHILPDIECHVETPEQPIGGRLVASRWDTDTLRSLAEQTSYLLLVLDQHNLQCSVRLQPSLLADVWQFHQVHD